VVYVVAAVAVLAAAISVWMVLAQGQAVEATRAREARLGRYQAMVADQAHRIDALFLRLEGMLRHLAGMSAFLAEHGVPSEERLYSHEDYDEEGRAPKDHAKAPLYGKAISLNEPVYKLAPGVEAEEVLPTVRRLLSLRRDLRGMLGASRPEEAALTGKAFRSGVAYEGVGVPLRWVYVGLADGVMFSYPGKGGYPAEYDPRQRPWYALGKGAGQPRWGKPYPDVHGKALVVPGVLAIHDSKGEFLGVAGVESSFNYIIDRYLLPDGLGDVGETFVLDDRGNVVLRSNERDIRIPPAFLDPKDVLDVFSVPDVVAAVRRKESGLFRIPDEGTEWIVSYCRIPTIGWYYVHRAELTKLLATLP